MYIEKVNRTCPAEHVLARERERGTRTVECIARIMEPRISRNRQTTGWGSQSKHRQSSPKDKEPQSNKNHQATTPQNDFLDMKQISAIQEQLKLLLGFKAQQQYSLPKHMGWVPQLVLT